MTTISVELDVATPEGIPDLIDNWPTLHFNFTREMRATFAGPAVCVTGPVEDVVKLVLAEWCQDFEDLMVQLELPEAIVVAIVQTYRLDVEVPE